VGPLLARLSPADRRSVALEVLLPLAADATSLVRAGVVEVLGEAIHCFHEDEHGPPDELVRLFLGREEDKRFWEDWLQRHGKLPPRQRPPSPAQIAAATSVVERLRLAALAESPPTFFDELSRPLLCAFNFPAVALTLGAARWPELRGTYLTLARSADAKIRRTLAASTGELARIIGAEHARTDVLGVWRDAVRYADAAVRLKAIEALEALLGAVDATDRVALVRTLDEVWEPCLRGFREREVVAQTFTALVGLLQAEAGLLGSLVRKALIDDVAAVREAAITAVPTLFGALGGRRDVRRQILDDIGQLAHHESYRKRMT
jgi:serine/threonine-protein phosphatase 4 regulatory subunit 1